ncbi:MAG TPA: MFS transporter [Acidimicrobiia bacterium]|nr:MFS transporter [Acidimicrobiia bacterium]
MTGTDELTAMTLEPAVPLDPRRWITLAIIIISAFIVVLDNTVLNVAIPTILREFHTTLPSLEWVITGYALTFATLLIIGGRLGDVYGHRRVFVIGAGLFGVGSLLASISHSVGVLIIGEALIEGIGASLMLPATLAILSGTFHGRERATAFAAWGATAGVAAASGPVVGGFLTNFYSWRWAFRINVIIAPLAILGAMLFMRRGDRGARRIKIDVPGAALIAVGMFTLVFALSEGALYGWITPLKDFSIAGHVVWPATRAISVIPFIAAFSAAVLVCFWFVEHAKERNHGDPLFEFAYLRFRTYRYGLLTGLILSMGQLGISFVLPVFLQNGRHISVWHNGLWVLPSGLFVIVGAQLGGRLIHRFGTIKVVRAGLVIYELGLLAMLRAISLHMTVWELLPGLALYGMGIGFALAQLTNVVLSEIPADGSGVASGANTTVRQVGSALGVAVIGSLLTVQTVNHAVSSIKGAALPAAVKADAIVGVHASGANYSPSRGLSAANAATLRSAVEHGVTSGTRWALMFAFVVVAIGTVVSFLVPNSAIPADDRKSRALEGFEPLEPLDADPALLG